MLSGVNKRSRLLALPVIVLQLVYLLSGSPEDSAFWRIVSIYMVTSIALWAVLSAYAIWRDRDARRVARQEARRVARQRQQESPRPRVYRDANGNLMSPPRE
ncbi:MAG: hypothetical protein ABR549_03040 [Mycobacteriales bacterium]